MPFAKNGEIESALTLFFDKEKRIPDRVSWKTGARGNTLTFLTPLEIDGIIAEGGFLRGTASLVRPDQEITVQLEKVVHGVRYHLQRLDWRPSAPHNNQGNGPKELRFCAISGTHTHTFAENSCLGLDALLPRGGLPVANPLEQDPLDFNQLIHSIRQQFKVLNSDQISEPPWKPQLF